MWQFTAMPDRPATDPAKPGTNLDKQLALGRRGGIRFVTADPVEEPKLKPKPKLRKAKAVLAAAEKATSKVGRPSSGEPWKALGISERTYYRRQKAEQRNGPVG